jgi:hypothetical protein
MLRIDIIPAEIRTFTSRICMSRVSAVGTPVTSSKQWSPITDVSLCDNTLVTLRKDTRPNLMSASLHGPTYAQGRSTRRLLHRLALHSETIYPYVHLAIVITYLFSDSV